MLDALFLCVLNIIIWQKFCSFLVNLDFHTVQFFMIGNCLQNIKNKQNYHVDSLQHMQNWVLSFLKGKMNCIKGIFVIIE